MSHHTDSWQPNGSYKHKPAESFPRRRSTASIRPRRSCRLARSIWLALWLAVLPALGVGCATSVSDYLEEAGQLGIAQTPGEVKKIEGLNSNRRQFLRDGIVLDVTDEPCRVTMMTREGEKVFVIGSGGAILLGKKKDWLLQEHGESPVTDGVPPSANSPTKE